MSNEHLVVEITPWGSVHYLQTLALRYSVLRKPLGLVFDPSIFPMETNDTHVIAKSGNRVVGCMILTAHGKDMKMRQVAVDPQFQRKGVGVQLVHLAEEKALNQGAETMVLHARDSAIPFYLSLGYSIVGAGFEEVGIPHHAMRKPLIG
ncbi:MAG: GNAT family N-acetyltransferase [Sphingomonadales bacterium]|nr:GNAT family N-acetyltransferase [Sphingomonadales bacterium]